MSFSAQTKTELCAIPVSRDCCAVAEAYGLLLFAHTFSHTEIAVVTANEALAKRVPPLLTRAFSAFAETSVSLVEPVLPLRAISAEATFVM